MPNVHIPVAYSNDLDPCIYIPWYTSQLQDSHYLWYCTICVYILLNMHRWVHTAHNVNETCHSYVPTISQHNMFSFLCIYVSTWSTFITYIISLYPAKVKKKKKNDINGFSNLSHLLLLDWKKFTAYGREKGVLKWTLISYLQPLSSCS